MVRRHPSPIAPAIIVALGCVVSPAFGSNPLSQAESRKLDPLIRQTLEQEARAVTSVEPMAVDGLLSWPRSEGGAIEIPCWIQLDPTRSLPAWCPSRSERTGAARARLSLAQIAVLAKDPAVLGIVAARKARPLLDVSVAEVGATQVHAASGSPPIYAGYDGTGVLIGVVDTGVDLDHPDFIRGGNTRLVALWDQTALPSINSPASFNYGRAWSAAEIDAGASTQVDQAGHGSHVLGIAAGTGAATGNGRPAYRHVGMAPGAALCVVKTDFYTSSIVDAVAWIFQEAALRGIPAVVNLSLGHHFGGHDGSEQTDLDLNALAGPGRIVVAAAGNEQEDAIHAETEVPVGDPSTISVDIDGYLPRGGAGNDYTLIDGYYTAGAALSLTVQTPNGQTIGPILPGTKLDQATTDGGVYIENDWVDSNSDDVEFFIQIYDKASAYAPVTGEWSLSFSRPPGAGGPNPEVDAWIYQTSLPARFAVGMTAEELVASPASADSVIAVAAYVTRKSWKSVNGNTYQYTGGLSVGEIAPFSSRGPRRDGALKPDVAAPGMGIGAALSSDASEETEYILDDGVHFIAQGTSMAAPHVTGLIALMLQVHGHLSRSALLQKIGDSARTDSFASGTPNAVWGVGKIDAVGATSQETPVLLTEVAVRRIENLVRLDWEVGLDLAHLDFRVMRVLPGEPEEERGIVGPGPRYTFVDTDLPPDGGHRYWLVALEGGKPRERFGPFLPENGTPIDSFSLAPPAPHPAVGEVHGSLSVPTAGAVTFEWYDATGKRIRRMETEVSNPGLVAYVWDARTDDGRQVPSGIYWLRVAHAGETRSQRIILLR
ncbi:MAG: S8 family serine peptidase [Candidatus Eisenbacteria bacterium]|nr:S8 family serine peptidase [Candidatus Eisenbacteria bacterium]